MTSLPNAEHRTPACGACGGDAECEEPGVFTCEDCRLDFTGPDLVAEFRNDSDETCGEPCDNWWHGPERIRRKVDFQCNPCALPKGHTADHWTGCRSVLIEGDA